MFTAIPGHHRKSKVWGRGTWRVAALSSQCLPTIQRVGPRYQSTTALNHCLGNHCNEGTVLWKDWQGVYQPQPQTTVYPLIVQIFPGPFALRAPYFIRTQDMLNQANSEKKKNPRWRIFISDSKKFPQPFLWSCVLHEPTYIGPLEKHCGWKALGKNVREVLCLKSKPLWDIIYGQ